MKNYWVIHIGQANKYSAAAYSKKCIALGWRELDLDCSSMANLEKRDFVSKIAPLLEEKIPGRTAKYYEGSARQLHKFLALMKADDIVLMPAENSATLHVAQVKSGYYYSGDEADLPYKHRRDVNWIAMLDKSQLSQPLKNSAGSIMTLFSLNPHAEEIERLVESRPGIASQEESIKDFGLESHLEEFIVANWSQISEFKNYEIYQEEGETVGQQYNTSAGRIDILARSKDEKSWLVIELKKGQTSDQVVGQTLRYIGWVRENEASEHEDVKGLVIAGESDDRLRLALKTVPHIDFMTYEVNFSLKKSG